MIGPQRPVGPQDTRTNRAASPEYQPGEAAPRRAHFLLSSGMDPVSNTWPSFMPSPRLWP